jgi:L-seryl-tRNA(Ser) seleniumtransferase
MPSDAPDTAAILRRIPAVDELLADPAVRALGLPPEILTRVIRDALDDFRLELRRFSNNGAPDPDTVPSRALQVCLSRMNALVSSQLVPAINATGILIHTGMGRSPLAPEALAAVQSVAAGYCDVAISRETGGRRPRSSGVDSLLRTLTGCEAALVVNNNAAATMLALHTLARDREVIVSRGQLVEIGGSFRLPEVMTAAGARLREVGTTNRTRLTDYAAAVGDQTGALMRIHPSNFRVLGFTESVAIEPLVELARSRNLPVIDDIGSGALLDFSRWRLTGEPPARASVEAGADLVLFSGDKLLGGPQAGILIGRRAAIERCAANPLMRALRVDKMTMAALEATLRLYLEPDRLAERLPLLRMIAEPIQRIEARGHRLLSRLQTPLPAVTATIEPADAFVGGGSLPEERLPSYALILDAPADRAESLKRRLRLGDPPVFCRLRHDRLEFDLRTVSDADVEPLALAIAAALAD